MRTTQTGTDLRGKDLEEFLFAGIAEKEAQIIEHLSKFEGRDLFFKWCDFLRCVDEFINLRSVLSQDEMALLRACRLDTLNNKNELFIALTMIRGRFGVDVFERIKRIVIMYSSMKMTYEKQGLYGLEFNNIAEAIGFCQSRRLYYVAYLSLIRLYAKGAEKIAPIEILCHFQYQIDYNMVAITSGLHGIMGSRCLDDYHGTIRADRALEFSVPYNQLEGFFLEPHTMSEVDILEFTKSSLAGNAPSGVPVRLYSFAELEYAVRQAEQLFGEYGISDCIEIREIQHMVSNLKGSLNEDYNIFLPKVDFEAFCAQYPHLRLCDQATDYYSAINERPAFFYYENCYYTSIFLLIRYVENTIYSLLRVRRRYRIKAGYVFEKKVEALLGQYGFQCTHVKRIHRQEFDVLCKKDDRVFNFQCKNNYIDINGITPANIDKICKRNKNLTRYYLKALDKEDFRIKLVMEHFGTSEVENFVVARYPIVVNHDRVIPYNRLEDWLKEHHER